MVRHCVSLRGLDAKAVYRTKDGAAYTGDTLMHAGVLLPKSWGDYYPVSMHFHQRIIYNDDSKRLRHAAEEILRRAVSLGRITPIETCAVTAMAGSFGYELDLNLLSDEEKEAVTQQIQQFKEYTAR